MTLVYVFGQASANGWGYVARYGPRNASLVFGVSVVTWALLLIVFAGPPWAVHHRAGRRGWRSALLLGSLLGFVVSLALFTDGFDLIPAAPGSSFSASDAGGPTVENNRLTPHGWVAAVRGALLMSAFAGAGGLAVWRAAYWEERSA